MTEQPDATARHRQAVRPGPAAAEYRIEDLAHHSGATVRTIRAYQDRGLLPKPKRRGRANVYGEDHLNRLRQIAGLLERGYTLASIKELLEAWDAGRGLGGILGLVAEVDGPWSDEKAARITRAELNERFGGAHDDEAVAEALELGVLERLPDTPDAFLVPSPQELAVAAELHAAGVPLPAISGHLRELRIQVEHIAGRFLDFTTEHVFGQYLGHPPSDEEAAEAAALVRRLRPLAQQTVDAELARAMRTLATRYLRSHLDETAAEATEPAAPAPAPAVEAPAEHPPRSRAAAAPAPAVEAVRLPRRTVHAVRALVGPEPERTEAFIAAAAEREVQARTMDALADRS
ncbi:MerR family transcriptional regulator [Streptomyces sp. ET3-23]|uniref:MerR family transcriptional regulator n=1 Tax=Streptomyces sp. ET3-23 TaxID=2885643 RepID=UPI002234EE2D